MLRDMLSVNYRFLLVFAFLLVGNLGANAQTEWEKHASNPVLECGPAPWDSASVWGSCVLKDPSESETSDSLYKMWYTAGVVWPWKVGLATSSDGINWWKHADPVFEPGPSGSWDGYHAIRPAVVYDEFENNYKMWYVGTRASGDSGGIGFAVSEDGIEWTRQPESDPRPVLWVENEDAPDLVDPWVDACCVIVISDPATRKQVFTMWYTLAGFLGERITSDIYCAQSEDGGLTWQKLGPALEVADTGWDSAGVTAPSVVFDGSTYHMWYTAIEDPEPPFVWRIGYATSANGRTFNRHGSNPILPLGVPPAWDSASTDYPTVLLDEENRVFKMWYDASHTSRGIGLAISPILARLRRADTNTDNTIDIADAIFTLSYLFGDGPAPSCLDAADANDDGAVDLADGIFILQNLFANGPAIPTPYPHCGVDPTEDGLGCESYPACE